MTHPKSTWSFQEHTNSLSTSRECNENNLKLRTAWPLWPCVTRTHFTKPSNLTLIFVGIDPCIIIRESRPQFSIFNISHCPQNLVHKVSRKVTKNIWIFTYKSNFTSTTVIYDTEGVLSFYVRWSPIIVCHGLVGRVVMSRGPHPLIDLCVKRVDHSRILFDSL